MDPQAVDLIPIVPYALAGLAALAGLGLCFSGYKLFNQYLGLPGLLVGAPLAGALAWLLWQGDPVPTILAAAIGGLAGYTASLAWQSAVEIGGGMVIGAVVGAALGAVLLVLLQQPLTPSALFWLILLPAIAGGVLAWWCRRLTIILATAFASAGLLSVALAGVAVAATDGGWSLELRGAMLLGTLILGVFGAFVQYRRPNESDTAAPDRAGRRTGRGTAEVFRNPAPAVWTRPRPVVLPEAITMWRDRNKLEFNARGGTVIASAPDGNCLGVGTSDGSVYLIDPETGQQLRTISLEADGSQRGVRGLR